jgi:phosphoglycolate phosphatase
VQNTDDVSAIFFDLDGTLTDPKEGITGCVQFALENMGETVPAKDELTWCIGPPLLKTFSQLVGSERAQEGVDWYRQRFSTIGLFENKVYEGIPEVLRGLAGRIRSMWRPVSPWSLWIRFLRIFRWMAFLRKPLVRA